jgi:hypothetical protein
MKTTILLLLVIAAVSAMGQDNLKWTISSVHTEKQNPMAGASYVALPDKIQFSFPDGTSFHFPRYDQFEPQATITVRPIGSLWHYDLVVTSDKTSQQPIRHVVVLVDEGTQFANVVTSNGWDDTTIPSWYGVIQPGGRASFSFDSDRLLPTPIRVSLDSEDISTSAEEMSRWEWPKNYRYVHFIREHLGTVQSRGLSVTPASK